MAEAKYLSVAEWSKLHSKDPGNTRRLIQQKRIPAQKVGSQWVIAADVLPPPDKRVKSGKYKDWRKKSGEQKA